MFCIFSNKTLGEHSPFIFIFALAQLPYFYIIKLTSNTLTLSNIKI